MPCGDCLFFFQVNIWFNSIPKMTFPLHYVEITTDPYKDSVPRYWCFHWFSWQSCALCTSWASSEVDEASSLKERHDKTIKRSQEVCGFGESLGLDSPKLQCWYNIMYVLYTVHIYILSVALFDKQYDELFICRDPLSSFIRTQVCKWVDLNSEKPNSTVGQGCATNCIFVLLPTSLDKYFLHSHWTASAVQWQMMFSR